MRRKTNINDHPLNRPDIRTLYTLLLLSFVDQTSSSQLKGTFLQSQLTKMQAMFKGIAQDPYAVVRRTLEISWSGIWEDKRLPRTYKVALFSDITVLQVCPMTLLMRLLTKH